MFRHKDRLLKGRRKFKKNNVNKEDKKAKPLKEFGSYMYYGYDKGLQQHLSDHYNIRVHKNVLRHKEGIEYEQKKGQPIGNTTYDNLKIALDKISPGNVPYDWSFKHDKTRWKSSKTKSKQRLNLRDDKYQKW